MVILQRVLDEGAIHYFLKDSEKELSVFVEPENEGYRLIMINDCFTNQIDSSPKIIRIVKKRDDAEKEAHRVLTEHFNRMAYFGCYKPEDLVDKTEFAGM